MKKNLLLVFSACAIGASAQQAPLPPTMGWSSWNTFGANISEQTICNQAQAMVDKGFFDAGYNFINIDDGYFANRTPEGRLIIHPTRFPNGMRPVVDFIHALGLKAGCYSDAGHNTCASKWGGETGGVGAGMYEHDTEDCEMYFNEFDFDFIKVDFCGGVYFHNDESLDLDPRERYIAIRNAIDATGREGVVFNACRWDYPGTWISEIADSWRISGDINASWGSVKDIIQQSLYLAPYCSPGHYNDMDMLEVGRGLTENEDITHFGMWCIMSSPLLIGCDLTRVSDSSKKLMCNPELIALNQDPLGLQAYVAKKTPEGAYVLVKDVETRWGTTRAVALYNPTDEAVDISFDFAEVDLGGEVAMRNLVTRRNISARTGGYSTTLQPHATKFLRLEGETRLDRTLYEGEHAYLPEYQELVNNSWAETATYVQNDNYHGGAGAGWLGKKRSNSLEWRDVYVSQTGEYDITIYYVSGENRNVWIDVNDTYVDKVTCNSGGWGTVKSFTRRISLEKGVNVISLYNATSGWMPDIDYMTLELVQAGITDVDATIADDDNRVIDLNGRIINSDGRTEDLPSGIYIHKGKKIVK